MQIDLVPARVRRRLVAVAVLRTVATVVVVVAVYFLVPMDRAVSGATAVKLGFGILALAVVGAWQIRQIMRSEYPGIRALQAVAFTVPVYILLFATAYYLMDRADASTFSQHLSRIDSMYFSATVFTTVGFGDITARSEAARAAVTVQEMLDLVILGLVTRLVVRAIQIGRERRSMRSDR